MEDKWECECSEEYGACEEHREVIAQREGASTRTADDLVYVFLTDVLAIGEERGWLAPNMLGKVNADRLRTAVHYWENDDLWTDNYGCRWVRDDVDAEIHDELSIGESVLADLGLTVDWEDGYVISRTLPGSPLLDI